MCLEMQELQSCTYFLLFSPQRPVYFYVLKKSATVIYPTFYAERQLKPPKIQFICLGTRKNSRPQLLWIINQENTFLTTNRTSHIGYL